MWLMEIHNKIRKNEQVNFHCECKMAAIDSEQEIWHLRHVGAPPTIDKSSVIIRLVTDGQVSVGRGPKADFFLDSMFYVRLISRIHAVIIGEKLANGHVRFTLTNKGLNGTYVNDLKLGVAENNSQILHEGDKVAFGHINCGSIRVGEYAPQPQSEFQFLFERIRSAQNPPSYYRDESSTNPFFSPVPSDTPMYLNAGNTATLNEYNDRYHPSSPRSTDNASEKENKIMSGKSRVHSFDQEEEEEDFPLGDLKPPPLVSLASEDNEWVKENDGWIYKAKMSNLSQSPSHYNEVHKTSSDVKKCFSTKKPLPDVVPRSGKNLSVTEYHRDNAKDYRSHSSHGFVPVSSHEENDKKFSVIKEIKRESVNEEYDCECSTNGEDSNCSVSDQPTNSDFDHGNAQLDCRSVCLSTDCGHKASSNPPLLKNGDIQSHHIKVECFSSLSSSKDLDPSREHFQTGKTSPAFCEKRNESCNILSDLNTNGNVDEVDKALSMSGVSLSETSTLDYVEPKLIHSFPIRPERKTDEQLKSKREDDKTPDFENISSRATSHDKVPEDKNIELNERHSDVTKGKNKFDPCNEVMSCLSSDVDPNQPTQCKSSSPVVVIEKMPDNIEGKLWLQHVKSRVDISKLKVLSTSNSKNIKKHHRHHHFDHNIFVKQSTSRPLSSIHSRSASKKFKDGFSHHIKHKKSKYHHSPSRDLVLKQVPEDNKSIGSCWRFPSKTKDILKFSENDNASFNEKCLSLSPTSSSPSPKVLSGNSDSKPVYSTKGSSPSQISRSGDTPLHLLPSNKTLPSSTSSSLSSSSPVHIQSSMLLSQETLHSSPHCSRSLSTGFFPSDFSSEDEERNVPNTTPHIMKKIYSPSRNYKVEEATEMNPPVGKNKAKSDAIAKTYTVNNASDSTATGMLLGSDPNGTGGPTIKDNLSAPSSTASSPTPITSVTLSKSSSPSPSTDLLPINKKGCRQYSNLDLDNSNSFKSQTKSAHSTHSVPNKPSPSHVNKSQDGLSHQNKYNGSPHVAKRTECAKQSSLHSLPIVKLKKEKLLSLKLKEDEVETKENKSTQKKFSTTNPKKSDPQKVLSNPIHTKEEKSSCKPSGNEPIVSLSKTVPSKYKKENKELPSSISSSSSSTSSGSTKPESNKISSEKKVVLKRKSSASEDSTLLKKSKNSSDISVSPSLSLSSSSSSPSKKVASHKKMSLKEMQVYSSSDSTSRSSSSSSSASFPSFLIELENKTHMTKRSASTSKNKKYSTKTDKTKVTSSVDPVKYDKQSSTGRKAEIFHKSSPRSSKESKSSKSNPVKYSELSKSRSQNETKAIKSNGHSVKAKLLSAAELGNEKHTTVKPQSDKSKEKNVAATKMDKTDTKLAKMELVKKNFSKHSSSNMDKKVVNSKQKRTAVKSDPTETSPSHAKLPKKNSLSVSKPVQGKKTGRNPKKKRKKSTKWSAPSDSSASENDDLNEDDLIFESDEWNLEDGIQYCDQPCSAKSCCNPIGPKVNWVMCDKCENWFHLMCVNTSIEKVQNEGDQFLCGFC